MVGSQKFRKLEISLDTGSCTPRLHIGAISRPLRPPELAAICKLDQRL